MRLHMAIDGGKIERRSTTCGQESFGCGEGLPHGEVEEEGSGARRSRHRWRVPKATRRWRLPDEP